MERVLQKSWNNFIIPWDVSTSVKMEIFLKTVFYQSDSKLLSISQKGQKIPLCNVPQAETNIYFRVALDMDIFTSGNETLYLMKLPVMKLSGLAIGRVSYQCTQRSRRVKLIIWSYWFSHFPHINSECPAPSVDPTFIFEWP